MFPTGVCPFSGVNQRVAISYRRLRPPGFLTSFLGLGSATTPLLGVNLSLVQSSYVTPFPIFNVFFFYFRKKVFLDSLHYLFRFLFLIKQSFPKNFIPVNFEKIPSLFPLKFSGSRETFCFSEYEIINKKHTKKSATSNSTQIGIGQYQVSEKKKNETRSPEKAKSCTKLPPDGIITSR